MRDIIEAKCPNCGRTRKTRRKWLGRKVECSCGFTFVLASPTVKKAEVEKSPAVETRKKSEARKKPEVPVVRSFEIKKTQRGAYNV